MARNEQLIRQHKILEILERYRFGRTLEEIRDDIVEELGLSSLHTRSIRRDLEALQAAGFDVDVHVESRGKIWKLGPMARKAHKISASATELMALSLGRDLLFPLAGTPFWQGIESFWNKIQDELPGSVWDHYEKYRRILYVLGMPAKNYDAHHGMLSTLNRAILEHRVVEIEYQPPGRPVSTRKIEPYAVVFYQSSLYIIAAAHEVSGENRIRHLKLDRFHKTTALDEWFKPDSDFKLEQHLGKSLGIFVAGGATKRFKIRISPSAAAWVQEDPWHPRQQIEKQADGGIVLTVEAANEMEIIPRVLALAENAEVLSPASCRKTLANIAQQLARTYGAS